MERLGNLNLERLGKIIISCLKMKKLSKQNLIIDGIIKPDQQKNCGALRWSGLTGRNIQFRKCWLVSLNYCSEDDVEMAYKLVSLWVYESRRKKRDKDKLK